jgi:hypothetical protein
LHSAVITTRRRANRIARNHALLAGVTAVAVVSIKTQSQVTVRLQQLPHTVVSVIIEDRVKSRQILQGCGYEGEAIHE